MLEAAVTVLIRPARRLHHPVHRQKCADHEFPHVFLLRSFTAGKLVASARGQSSSFEFGFRHAFGSASITLREPPSRSISYSARPCPETCTPSAPPDPGSPRWSTRSSSG